MRRIGARAFYNCEKLKEVTLPTNTLSELPDGLFDGCSSLSKINLPIGLKSIGNRAFADCTSLRNVNVPEGVTKIGGYAFSEVQGSITFPSTVKELGVGVGPIFSNNDDITIGRTVYLKAKTPPSIYIGHIKNPNPYLRGPILGTFKILYVPVGCKQKYLDAGIYGVYDSNVEEYDFD